jgi:hypothetical protein
MSMTECLASRGFALRLEVVGNNDELMWKLAEERLLIDEVGRSSVSRIRQAVSREHCVMCELPPKR